MHNIGRKTASKLLKVSIRTIDRYIAANKLSIEKRDGHIWLNKKEIQRLRDIKRVDSGSSSVMAKMSIDNSLPTPVGMSIDSVDFMSTPNIGRSSSIKQNAQEQVYQKLFEELRQELKIKQERLEGANYRVGQLEGLLKDSVPLLDYQRALNQERTAKEGVTKNLQVVTQHLEQTKNINQELAQKIKSEKTDKRIYLILLFFIMLLQPLWLLFSLR